MNSYFTTHRGCCSKFLPPRPPEGAEVKFLPSYRQFWQSGVITIANGNDIPFNHQSIATEGGITLLPPSTILIPLAGDYEIQFTLTTTVAAAAPLEQQVTVIVNGVVVPNSQATFGTMTANEESCDQFSGTVLLRLPANSTLSLRNTSPNAASLTLCNLAENGASLIIKKVS